VCGGKNSDWCAQKRDRLCGASLLVRVGSPMIVLLTILEGDSTGFHYRDEIIETCVTLILVIWTRTLWL